MNLKVNLYPICTDMERQITEAIQEASEKRIKIVEIAYGEASDTVKKRLLNFLNQKEIRRLYTRLEKTEKGWGRIYLHFRRE